VQLAKVAKRERHLALAADMRQQMETKSLLLKHITSPFGAKEALAVIPSSAK